MSGPGVGADLADFVVGEQLGAGGSATVHAAVHVSLGAEVALKRWRVSLSEAEKLRFWGECRLQWRLSEHPNVVRLYWADAGDAGAPWLAMERFEESLADRLSRPESGDLAAVEQIAQDLLTGLAAIHEAGVVHRDVKPGNVLLKAGRAAVGDLGIAMAADKWTQDHAAGTARYLAPELVRGEAPSFRSDVYSAAVTIYAAFRGQPPEWLDSLLVRASSFDPADRPADATVFLRQYLAAAPRMAGAVAPVLTGHPRASTASAPEAASPAGFAGLRRHRRRGAATVFLAVILLLALTASTPRTHSANPTATATAAHDAYITDHDQLFFIDGVDIAGSLTLGFSATALSTSADGERLYALGYDSLDGPGRPSLGRGQLAVVDTIYRSLLAVIELSPGFGDAALTTTPDDRFAYASCSYCDTIDKIDLLSNSIVGEVPGGVGGTLSLISSADGALIYITGPSEDGATTSTLSVVDAVTNRIVNSAAIGFFAGAALVSHDGARIFVSTHPSDPQADPNAPHEVLVLDGRTLAPVARTGPQAGAGLWASSDGREVYSVKALPRRGFELTTIDTDRLTSSSFMLTDVKPPIDSLGGSKLSLISPEVGGKIYLVATGPGGGGHVVAADTNQRIAAATVTVTAFPAAAQLGRNGRFLYVPSSPASAIRQVSVVDPTTMLLLATLSLGVR